MLLHFIIDLIAIGFSLLIGFWFRQKNHLLTPSGVTSPLQSYYLLTLIIGLTLGSVLLGTLNTYLAGHHNIAKSMIGGIFGAILFAEIFKKIANISQSTGFYFVPSLLVLIIIGRIGCFYAGLDDYTYGISTPLAWGVDFGDGIKRHPVQLYESFSMAIFLLLLLFLQPKNPSFWQQKGFYLFILAYASQRFVWEFFKPYPTLMGPFNLFHMIAMCLCLYAIIMLFISAKHVRS